MQKPAVGFKFHGLIDVLTLIRFVYELETSFHR